MNVSVSMPTVEEWKAFGRHVVTYSAGFAMGAGTLLGYGVALHILTPDQSTALGGAFTNIASGLKAIVTGLWSVIGGLSTVVATSMAVWASFSSSNRAAAKIAAGIPGTTIVTSPAVAASVPAPNVVANTEHSVVPPAPKG